MHNFKEKELGSDFAKEKLADFKNLISSGRSFTVVSMPGVGVSYFLKYLTCQDFAYFIHIDLYSLPSVNQHEFYKLLLSELGGKPTTATDEQVFLEIKAILKKLASKNEKLVIIFSRFDQLSKDFDANFLSNIQSLAAQNLTTLSNNIVLIFTAVKPLHELSPEAVSGGNLSFYSKIYYFKPFTSLDLKNLLNLEGVTKAQPNLDKMIKMSGGHNQLLHILLNSQKQQNLLLDQFVRLQLKDLISYLSYQQRKQLQKLAANKNVSEIDEYLSGVGMVSSKGRPASGWEFQIFTPLLTGYIKTNIPVRLPVKEAKLLKLLRNNLGKTVSKDEIFAEVWSGSEEATDWALDALIYRLRKHPFMISNGYIIESHKKVGYTLIQT